LAGAWLQLWHCSPEFVLGFDIGYGLRDCGPGEFVNIQYG
jgi:hypothetical protein